MRLSILASCAALLAAGCSGNDANTGTTDAGSADAGADTGPPPSGIAPPSLPANATATTSTEETNFAVASLLLGDVARGESTQSATAWKDFGYDIDGKISTRDSTDLCTPDPGAQKEFVYGDGSAGIDNSFGENIVPILLDVVGTDMAAQTNASIQNGDFTIEIEARGLTDATQTSSGTTGYLDPAGSFDDGGPAPTFSTADDWPVLASWLGDASNPATSKTTFPNAYVVNGTWVSAPFRSSASDVPVTLRLGGAAFTFVVHHAVVTFDHTSATKAAHGTIAGVIRTDEFIEALRAIKGSVSSALCGSGFDGLAAQIRQASDILDDGTNAAGVPCNAISIGIGFVGVQIAVADSAIDPPPPGATCP